MTQPTLVLMPKGKTSRRVIPQLEARGIAVRGGSRGTTPPFDWDNPNTWEAALDGVSAAYVVYSPDLTFPGAPENIAAFAELAVNSGVPRLVLLSGRGERAAEHCEQMVQNSGADWTIVRASWF